MMAAARSRLKLQVLIVIQEPPLSAPLEINIRGRLTLLFINWSRPGVSGARSPAPRPPPVIEG